MGGAVKSRTRPVIGRQALIRHGVESVLAVLLVTIILGFISQVRHRGVRETSPQPAQASPSPDIAQRTLAVTQYHLFGQAAGPSTYARLPESALALAGIIYSTTPDDSRAMLLINGVTTIVASGAQLPDGSKVTGIEPDRIAVERDGVTRQVMLEMDAADPNAHFTLAAVDADGNLSEAAADTQSDASRRAVSSAAPMNQIYRASAVPFSAIRGKDAASRFKNIHPPVLVRKPARP